MNSKPLPATGHKKEPTPPETGKKERERRRREATRPNTVMLWPIVTPEHALASKFSAKMRGGVHWEQGVCGLFRDMF